MYYICGKKISLMNNTTSQTREDILAKVEASKESANVLLRWKFVHGSYLRNTQAQILNMFIRYEPTLSGAFK